MVEVKSRSEELVASPPKATFLYSRISLNRNLKFVLCDKKEEARIAFEVKEVCSNSPKLVHNGPSYVTAALR